MVQRSSPARGKHFYAWEHRRQRVLFPTRPIPLLHQSIFRLDSGTLCSLGLRKLSSSPSATDVRRSSVCVCGHPHCPGNYRNRHLCMALSVRLAFQSLSGSTQRWRSYDNTATGATHGAELRGMFRVPQFDDSEVTTLFSQMREYWTSFATSGTPSASGGPTWEVCANCIDGPSRR